MSDRLMNLVMDEVEELLHNPANGETTGQRRSLGLAVLRGTNLTLISPVDGFEMIEKCVSTTDANSSPFSQAE
ncbi:U6 snRNP-associated protein Lsm7 [Malassezia caprae]|uniref:U6 snRNP-associated protein Lsm7 n=1 Tax=Malassezia caprae TaxID=1381934 RepID=A0AAF0E8X4_9BASI|nr:U6 snRNP-associated protein Lsm7 [Malassezia caprae]